MPIVKCLDCSTAHFPKVDVDIFSDISNLDETDTPFGLPRICAHHYGFVIYFGDVKDGEGEEYTYSYLRKACEAIGLSNALESLVKHARANGCIMINLDADGEVIKGLPVYEW